MLTSEDIRLILESISREVVAEFAGYTVTRRQRGGYHDDPRIGGLQAKLSIMLEAKARVGSE